MLLLLLLLPSGPLSAPSLPLRLPSELEVVEAAWYCVLLVWFVGLGVDAVRMGVVMG